MLTTENIPISLNTCAECGKKFNCVGEEWLYGKPKGHHLCALKGKNQCNCGECNPKRPETCAIIPMKESFMFR